ncbi:citrate lyase subunit beta [Streptomyces sp. SPB78]|nr:citrate lyase subunit beta [Streptomyces sp. SPB78]
MTSEARENGLSSTPLTWLYVPGDRPARVEKALAAGADVVLVDLEDAVAPDGKEYARAAVVELLSTPVPVPVHVRVNHLDGPWGAQERKRPLSGCHTCRASGCRSRGARRTCGARRSPAAGRR